MDVNSIKERPTTRGHKYRLVKENTQDTIRSNFFNNRIVNNWNALSSDVIEAKSINSFKAKLDKIFEINKTYKTTKKTK